jgi:hypothetical protein
MKRIKRFLCVVVALLMVASISTPAWAATADPDPLQKDDLFAGTDQFSKGAKSVTEVNLDKNMLALMDRFGGKDAADKDQLNLAKHMDFIYVRSYEYENAGQYKASDLEAFRQRLEGPSWSHVVKQHGKDEENDVWIRTDSEGQFSELVVINAEPSELNFVHLKGHMTIEQLTQVGAKYGVPQPQPEKRSK